MKEAHGFHEEVTDALLASIVELSDLEPRGQVVQVHRKERIVHAQTEELA